MPKLPETIVMSPGVDIHDHFREPSLINTAETFESGTLSALLGGYIVTCDMPNTLGSETWTRRALYEKRHLIYENAYVYTGIHAGSQPNSDNLDELGPMSRYAMGLKVYLGPTTGNTTDLTIMDVEPAVRRWHAEAPEKPVLVHRGNADLEEIIGLVARDTRHPLHICHVNDPEEVAIVAAAKKAGLPVTCGVCPHHLFMTSHDVMTKGAFAEMQPPLARQPDAEKLWELLVGGDIDIIETDHAPHPVDKKWEAEHSRAGEHALHCYGVPGIKETMPQLLNQARLGKISLERIEEATSTKPAEIISIRLGLRTKVTWSNELYQIDDAPELERQYTNPYIGNLAVGRVVSLRDGFRELAVGDAGIQKVKNPILVSGQIV
jgi:dihydroorotase-like cyclic amidohydrolase